MILLSIPQMGVQHTQCLTPEGTENCWNPPDWGGLGYGTPVSVLVSGELDALEN